MFRRFSLRPTLRLALRASLLMLLLSGCVNVRDDLAQNWPDDIPPHSFFVEAYQADPENHEFQTQEKYLYWVRAFYEGTTLYPRGWYDLTDGILAQTEDSERAAQLQEELYLLGRNIATEWSKSNRVNLIKSGNLAVWGVAAERAGKEGNVDETLAKITTDVEKLLAEELNPGAITASRYHEQDPNDFFAF
ncbi:MAG: hypothetical protein AAGG55_05145 [Pseudomonadota bacterium]